jgi:hypothetical protein
MVRAVTRFLLIALIYGGQCLSPKVAITQDFATLMDVARANGESLQNYDVSYRKSAIANLPKDQEGRDSIKRMRESKRILFWEEKEEIGRLVILKGFSNNPKRILFIRRNRIFSEGKVASHTDFMLWDDGIRTSGTTMNPRSGEIAKGKCTLARFYRFHFVPSFETYIGSLMPPEMEGYWEDHSAYWDHYKSGGAGIPVVRLPNGKLRIERSFETVRSVTEYDPISSLIIFLNGIPIDKDTGKEKMELATSIRVTWEKYQDIYRLKSIVARSKDNGLMSDDVETFHWHQCNEVDFKFPSELVGDFSLDRCTRFLIDGQSELSNER